jgi:NAD(P)-dependent dehydrogenase (short-subunit alcohol dehydrogenase family)
MSKVALVTGANKGIGLETARQLAARGVSVIVAARDERKAESAAVVLRSEGLTANALQLDVTSTDSINQAAEAVHVDHGRLDILINNAGVLLDDGDKRASEQSLKLWRDTFETNLFGTVAVTKAFLPLLLRSPAARIVNVSSVLGSLTLRSDPGSRIYDSRFPAYDASKSAINAWTLSLARELRDTPVKVNSAHPGYVKTDMGGSGALLEISEGAKTSVALALLEADGPSGGFFHMGKPLPW